MLPKIACFRLPNEYDFSILCLDSTGVWQVLQNVLTISLRNGHRTSGFVVLCERNLLRLTRPCNVVEEIKQFSRKWTTCFFGSDFGICIRLCYKFPFVQNGQKSNLKRIFFFELIVEKELLCPWSVPV